MACNIGAAPPCRKDMPAPISVVIPTLSAAPQIGPAVVALMPGLDAGLIRDLVITDGGSSDGIDHIAEDLGAVFVSGPAGRGGQIARGVEAASGDWVLILHADTRLSPEWVEAARNHIASSPDLAGYFRLRFDARGPAPRVVAGWANLRSRFLGLPYGDQGVLVRRAVLAEAGGVPPIPLMEDVALARQLKGRLVALEAEAVTSAARYERDGWIGRGTRNLLTLGRYLAGTPPERLVRGYSASSENCSR